MRRMAERFIALRAVGEVGATAIYLTALVHLDLANATDRFHFDEHLARPRR